MAYVPRWEHFDHPSDIGLRGIGATPAAAFEQAALALTAVGVEPGRVAPSSPVRIVCESSALDLLLVDWLSAVLLEMGRRQMLFSKFDVRLDHLCLEATAWGEPANALRHEPSVEVKGITFNELSVRQEASGEWIAECVVDV